ncbi:hypothetical protein COV16_03925, partial [Candidatus Woesearchaeota archaeon CG10_big_fil_rev_8_21_14_0_10_34_8]
MLIYLLVFIVLSASSLALTSTEEEKLADNYYKLNPETYNTLAVASGTDEDHYIIEFTDADSASKYGSSVKAYMSNSKTLSSNTKAYLGKVQASDVITLLEQDYIEYIELEQETTGLYTDHVTYNVKKTEADQIWDETKGTGVSVAVLDTGIYAHDDLSISGGTSIISADYNDYDGHGTEVAGVLAAVLDDNGIAGVAPDVSLYAVKIMNTTTGNLSDAIEGLQWAIDNNMSIVVMSFGFEGFSNIFRDKVNEFYNNGGLLVAAAGNGGGTIVMYPA